MAGQGTITMPVLVWLMFQNRVWTAGRLLQHQWQNLMIECTFTRAIWFKISDWASLLQLHPRT
jgi:hypothetical protein